MNSLKKSLLVAAMFVFGGTTVFAQTRELGPEWGENATQEERYQNALKFNFYRDAYNSQRYDDALGYLPELIKNSPRGAQNIYVYAINIYKNKIQRSMDLNQRKGYVDSLIVLYDLREQYFGNDARTYRSSFRLPHRFGGGLYYQGTRWSGGVDYRFDGWGINGVDATTGVRYRDTHTVSAGVQLVPKAGDVRKIMNRWSYRLGFRYSQYYMAFDGHNIDEKVISLGLGIPLGTRGVNAIDLGFEFGTRGVAKAGLIRENFVRLSIGLSLFGDDYWFMKYKYD